MSFTDRYKENDEPWMHMLSDYLSESEKSQIIEAIGIASDTLNPETRAKYDAVVGTVIRKVLEQYLRDNCPDDDYEEMLGNFAYDAIAKDRATGYGQ